jgi:hypothetical protein
MKQLTTEERQILISLLCKLPNIRVLEERLSLTAGLPESVQNNIASSMVPQIHISNIVNTLGDDAYFELTDGSYPIITVIRTAQNKLKDTPVYNELQTFMMSLNDRCNPIFINPIPASTVLKPAFSPTLLSLFQQELHDLITALSTLEEELQRSFASFNSRVIRQQCRAINIRIIEACSPIHSFSSLLQKSDDLPLEVVAHNIWLRKELMVFDRDAKIVCDSISQFCEVYGTLMEQPQERRKEIQQQLAILIRCCQRISGTAKELQKTLDEQ